jgi:hypothetical protein
MKPTQEQITEALQNTSNLLAWGMLDDEDSAVILAVAYRKLLEKNQEQKKYILELTEELDGWTSPN